MKRVVQVVVGGVIASPVLYQVVWPVVVHVWPPACPGPDGFTLMCRITDAYTRPRDLTAVGISVALGLIAAIALHLVTSRLNGSSALTPDSARRRGGIVDEAKS